MTTHTVTIALTESQTLRVSEDLEAKGFEYDTDFTTLHGAKWAVVGLTLTPRAAAAALASMEYLGYAAR